MTLAPALTPHGVLTLRAAEDAVAIGPQTTARLEAAFARGSGHGLLCLGLDELGTSLPPVLSYWRGLATRYVAAVRALTGIGEARTKPPIAVPADVDLERLASAIP